MSYADWYPDPSGRFTSRFWDGVKWTDLCAGSEGGARDEPDATWAPPVAPVAPAPIAAVPPAVRIRFCVFCGAELAAGRRFCLKCGGEAPAAFPTATPTPAALAPAPLGAAGPALPGIPSQPPGGFAGADPLPARKPFMGTQMSLVIVGLVILVVIGLAVASGSSGNSNPHSADHTACASGDMSACDSLYAESSSGSAEETFGSTCGGTEEPQSGDCVLNYGSASGDATDSTDHAACASGDMSACDSLYAESPSGSTEETFGSTCGGTEDPQDGECAIVVDP